MSCCQSDKAPVKVKTDHKTECDDRQTEGKESHWCASFLIEWPTCFWLYKKKFCKWNQSGRWRVWNSASEFKTMVFSHSFLMRPSVAQKRHNSRRRWCRLCFELLLIANLAIMPVSGDRIQMCKVHQRQTRILTELGVASRFHWKLWELICSRMEFLLVPVPVAHKFTLKVHNSLDDRDRVRPLDKDHFTAYQRLLNAS